MQELGQRWRPLVRVTALGMMLGILATPIGIAHLDVTPDVCARAAASLEVGSTRVVANPTWDLHDHCFTCHWLQSFRSTLIPSGAVVLNAEGMCPVPAGAAAGCERLVIVSVPARAPPASQTVDV